MHATRRAVLLGSLAALAGPRAAAAQSARVWRIAWLAPAPNPANLDAFRGGLRSLGYVEGATVTIDERYAGPEGDRLSRLASELGRRNTDVVVTDGSAAASAMKQADAATPVVFVSGDPVTMGLVPRLSRPGGNLTGLAIVSTELNVKRLELVHQAFPRATRVGVLYEQRQRDSMLAPVEAAARALALQVTPLEVRIARDLDGAFATAARSGVSVVIPVASALFHAEKRRLLDLAARHRLPAMYENRAFPDAGGLMSYGPDLGDVFRRAAGYVDRILKGAAPGDLPIEQPNKFELVINRRTAKALGLMMPPALLLRADHLIE